VAVAEVVSDSDAVAEPELETVNVTDDDAVPDKVRDLDQELVTDGVSDVERDPVMEYVTEAVADTDTVEVMEVVLVLVPLVEAVKETVRDEEIESVDDVEKETVMESVSDLVGVSDAVADSDADGDNGCVSELVIFDIVSVLVTDSVERLAESEDVNEKENEIESDRESDAVSVSDLDVLNVTELFNEKLFVPEDVADTVAVTEAVGVADPDRVNVREKVFVSVTTVLGVGGGFTDTVPVVSDTVELCDTDSVAECTVRVPDVVPVTVDDAELAVAVDVALNESDNVADEECVTVSDRVLCVTVAPEADPVAVTEIVDVPV
jgi:hypothetical protein